MPEHFKEEPGLTRRTIMRTAAWSVPVIAAAVATPMAAASETLTDIFVGYVGTAPPRIQVSATTSSKVIPLPEHFVVNGEPQVQVVYVMDSAISDLTVELLLNKSLPTVIGYTLTISLPGFTPVTVPITER